jgi:hypothetical protein
MITEEEILSARTPNGGWTKETLASWGIAWPPPKGWKKELIKKSKEKSSKAVKEIE